MLSWFWYIVVEGLEWLWCCICLFFRIDYVVLFVFIECVVDVCVFFVVIVMEILVFDFSILSYVGFFFGIVDVI